MPYKYDIFESYIMLYKYDILKNNDQITLNCSPWKIIMRLLFSPQTKYLLCK